MQVFIESSVSVMIGPVRTFQGAMAEACLSVLHSRIVIFKLQARQRAARLTEVIVACTHDLSRFQAEPDRVEAAHANVMAP
ncbi:hypothetical protein AUC61_18110 [Pseudomonas sp. S25]|uniref:Uncharacterized protein n=1 Tax=Pseudomonas maioricensis TaxID=1766623 RepID=A0ABS9ZME7_9PSED|nr:hypothetical protein [Pseudomonas sp. S25]